MIGIDIRVSIPSLMPQNHGVYSPSFWDPDKSRVQTRYQAYTTTTPSITFNKSASDIEIPTVKPIQLAAGLYHFLLLWPL